MNKKELQIKQLDEQISQLENFHQPKQGWVRTIRKAFGMTLIQLAKRLKVHPSRVVRIEIDERDGAVTLRTLQNVADAIDCDLVYGFVPKLKTFRKVIEAQAEKIAQQQVERTSHSMKLEAQTTSAGYQLSQTKALKDEILNQPWKYLWVIK